MVDGEELLARFARVERGGKRLLLCQPQTYMNLSGESVGSIAGYRKIELSRVLVVVDDADLPFGEIRLRPSGSSGGHHGLESVEQHLGSRDYARQRIAIGRQGTSRLGKLRGMFLRSLVRWGQRDIWQKILQKGLQSD